MNGINPLDEEYPNVKSEIFFFFRFSLQVINGKRNGNDNIKRRRANIDTKRKAVEGKEKNIRVYKIIDPENR